MKQNRISSPTNSTLQTKKNKTKLEPIESKQNKGRLDQTRILRSFPYRQTKGKK